MTVDQSAELCEPAGKALGSPVFTVVPNRDAKRRVGREYGVHKPGRSRCTRGAKKRGVRRVKR